MRDDPFFILGCVRSGTTMLRDLLRSVPGLCCPEETHFYRWAQPYGTRQYEQNYRRNQVLARHREIDGVTEDEMAELLDTARSRREFSDRYMDLFREKQGLAPDTRWFDKTPQNIYCVELLARDYAESRFVHIYRDPRNVVASLAVGKVMKVDNVVGAANYWRESEVLAAAFERAHPDRMLSVSYAELTGDPVTVVRRICRFVDIEQVPPEELGKVRHERNAYAEVLDPQALELVEDICGPIVRELGYSFDR
ncbi:MAG: sulfotransferase [Acidimicrobiia bacterium]|nr:sulfotransferase [Acidimicrobiia bacterium]